MTLIAAYRMSGAAIDRMCILWVPPRPSGPWHVAQVSHLAISVHHAAAYVLTTRRTDDAGAFACPGKVDARAIPGWILESLGRRGHGITLTGGLAARCRRQQQREKHRQRESGQQHGCGLFKRLCRQATRERARAAP